MAAADDSPRPRGPWTDLLRRLVTGAVVVGLLGAIDGLIHGGLADATASGAVTGLIVGAAVHWQARRSQKYRGSFDPAELTLTRADVIEAGPVPATGWARRRYGVPAALLVVLTAALAGAITVVGLAAAAPDASGAVVWFFVGVAIVAAAVLLTAGLTYTEVSTSGLRVRTPTRSQTIGWAELAEVRWHRNVSQDVLRFYTVDGREINSGVAVAHSGFGHRRATKLLVDIRQTWAQSGR